MNEVRATASGVVKLVDTHDTLGECATWDASSGTLYWVDSFSPCVHAYRWEDGSTTTLRMPERVGSLALRQGGGLLVALESSIGQVDVNMQAVSRWLQLEPPEKGMRLNDGRCDRSGRFWVGSKLDVAPSPGGVQAYSTQPVGSLFRIHPDGSFAVADDGIVSPNSLAWSPDGRTMYFADSALKKIFQYPFEPSDGSLGPRRLFVQTESIPDGSTIDAEGYLWNASYNGWSVIRYAPDGRVDTVINLPVRTPTCCCLGGPDLRTLLITTGRRRLTDTELEEQPLAGSVLMVDVPVPGLPEPRFGD